jgi:ribosome-binding ATPase YchF (GTP1/OBG family)
LITNAEELKTELVTDVGMQKPKARRLLRALRAVVEGLKGTPAPQSTTHRLQVPLAGEMKENLPVALEAVLITQELQSAPNFVEMEKIIRDQLERDHNGQMIQALAEQEAALEAAHKAHILAIRNEMALALPKVSTPVLNPDGNFRLATVTSKPKHMVKTWTIQNWSTVVRVPGRILYDREFFLLIIAGGGACILVVSQTMSATTSLCILTVATPLKNIRLASAIRFAL